MVQREREVRNAARREHLAQQDRKTKAKAKLSKRLATKKAEAQDKTGELRRERLAKNIPRTVDNTREWVGGDDDEDEENSDDADPEAGPSSLRNLEDVEDDEEGDAGESSRKKEQGDKRTRPVKIKNDGLDENGDGELVLDMAGLEDIFKPQDPNEPPKPILLTTSPRPHGRTYDFLNELQSLLGGKRYAEIFPRKNSRFELSKVCKWAAKRGYGAIIVVGEDLHGEPATMTISLLPHGPCAHFRLTNIALHRQISKSANPTSHIPELVLSNFSTPLGLTTGRLLQSLFPPMPNFVGRQVVAIHNQRDFIFFRRFRYMFALREGEASAKLAKERGLDEQLRTRMQEIGPRFTLKIRWLKRGSLGEGRKRGSAGVTQEPDNLDDIMANLDQPQSHPGGSFAQDQRDEESARREMMDQLGEQPGMFGEPLQHNGQEDDAVMQEDSSAAQTETSQAAAKGKSAASPSQEGKKRKRSKSESASGSIKIPQFKMPKELPKAELPHARKLKKNASILDSIAVTVGHNRGGMKKNKLEWEWNPRMQVSRRKFAL
ncbi:Brix-domain-containing protein [Cystobasidium minutum MCA 4210]|uniref:Brix-domain-containing protein n=1 Tax=Cystobasidium minutum MCA 4210 TaxID=1397322 RepID=UPI0034D01723|eukprot:jgi/Rhomi1/184655/fgenesh1_pm.11_\